MTDEHSEWAIPFDIPMPKGFVERMQEVVAAYDEGDEAFRSQWEGRHPLPEPPDDAHDLGIQVHEVANAASAGTHIGGGAIDIAQAFDIPCSFIDWAVDLEFVRAYREAEERYARAVALLCPFGRCVINIDPKDGKIFAGAGDPLCGCDNLPGWNATRYESLPKPGWSGKAKGRHGSRVQRSRARRREWQAMVKEIERERRAWYAEQASWYLDGLS